LSGLSQSGAIPGNIIVAGYNLGLLVPGVNTIPANVRSTIEATNTVEGVQNTNTVAGSVMTTIADPDGIPGTGDETATDASFSVSYNDLNWTAGASGTIGYRQDSIATAPPTAASNTLLINIVIGGFLNVQFRCAPGTVTGPDPGVIALIDPAPSFDTTSIEASVNNPPTADAGPDQMVASGATVNLDGTGSSDPDSDPLTYSWTQIGGPAVTLTGADTAMPSFTAPTGPTTLVFDLEVCDGEPLCDTDTVAVTVDAPIPVFLGFTQPLPKTKLAKSSSAITVKFRLGDDAGMPLSDLEASQLQTQVTLSANLDGSNPLSLVTCAYSKTNHRYQCSLKPPKNVAKYPTPYYITAYELIGGTNVKAPTGSSSTTDNPVTIYFK